MVNWRFYEATPFKVAKVVDIKPSPSTKELKAMLADDIAELNSETAPHKRRAKPRLVKCQICKKSSGKIAPYSRKATGVDWAHPDCLARRQGKKKVS